MFSPNVFTLGRLASPAKPNEKQSREILKYTSQFVFPQTSTRAKARGGRSKNILAGSGVEKFHRLSGFSVRVHKMFCGWLSGCCPFIFGKAGPGVGNHGPPAFREVGPMAYEMCAPGLLLWRVFFWWRGEAKAGRGIKTLRWVRHYVIF